MGITLPARDPIIQPARVQLSLARELTWREWVLTLHGKVRLGFSGGRIGSAQLAWTGAIEYLANRARMRHWHRYVVRESGVAVAPSASGTVLTLGTIGDAGGASRPTSRVKTLPGIGPLG